MFLEFKKVLEFEPKVPFLFQQFTMYQLKVFLLFVIICFTFLLANKIDEFQKLYVAAVRCNMSEKFVYSNYSCFAKSYSRTVSTVNAIGTTKTPLYNIFVETFIQSSKHFE